MKTAQGASMSIQVLQTCCWPNSLRQGDVTNIAGPKWHSLAGWPASGQELTYMGHWLHLAKQAKQNLAAHLYPSKSFLFHMPEIYIVDGLRKTVRLRPLDLSTPTCRYGIDRSSGCHKSDKLSAPSALGTIKDGTDRLCPAIYPQALLPTDK